jgi:hypothetical protein
MAATPDKFPSGSWGFGPVLVQWSLKSINEADVTVSVLGIQIDELDLLLNKGCAEVSSDINLLDLVKGTLGLKAIYDQPNGNGLYINGQLSGPGFDTGVLNYCIIPW